MAFEQNPWDINYINKPDNTSYLPPAQSVSPVASAPPASPAISSKPVASLSTDSGATSLAKDEKKFETYTSAQYDADLANERANAPAVPTPAASTDNGSLASAGKYAGATTLAERQKIEDEGAYTAEELAGMGITDVSNFTKTSSGKFKPTAKGYEEMGLTGVEDSKASELDKETDLATTNLENKIKEVDSWNIDTDPVFAAQAQEIRNQYAQMIEEMKQVNEARKQAYEALGYKSGTTRFAGSTQMGTMGAELSQATKRISDLVSKENAAVSAARLAYQQGKYQEFSFQVNNLATLRNMKADELKTYNENLKNAADAQREDDKFELDKLKYLQDAKTTDIKEFEYAQTSGFEGSYMDYLSAKEELKVANPNTPSSYLEWSLAGGEAGTGKTYGEFIAKSTSQGPASYQEWSLAGGQAGTGKSYAEWVGKDKGLDTSTMTKVQTIANSFDSEQAVKSYQVSAEAIDAIKRAGTTPTDDISRVYAFAKVMDPNSVVREGEYKTVQDYSTALLERMGLKAKRVFDNTGFLTEEARNFMLATLNNRLASSEKAYKNIYDEYGRRINKLTGQRDGTEYLPDYSKAFEEAETINYKQELENAVNTGKISEEEWDAGIKDFNDKGYVYGRDFNEEDVYNYFKKMGKLTFNQEGSASNNATGMRTDRHNNPTAFTTDIAKTAGLQEGVDYTKGDPFSGGKYYTATLLGDPVDTTIKVIDKIGFYTQSGKQRWTHTAISQSQWNKMSYEQKKQVVKKMYQAEGNQGELNQYFG